MAYPRHLILLCVLATTGLSEIDTLPITSKPLDSSPDHLAWDALLTINSYQSDGREEVRKIPKSIFITPNFNESFNSCKPGFRFNPDDGRCYKESIPVDQQSLLAMQALQAFNKGSEQTQADDSYTDSIDYDYEEDSAPGPYQYQIPLTLSFGSDTVSTTPRTGSATESGFRSPFPVTGVRSDATKENSLTRRTTNALPTDSPVSSTTAADDAPTADAGMDGNPSAVSAPHAAAIVAEEQQTTTRTMDATVATTEFTKSQVTVDLKTSHATDLTAPEPVPTTTGIPGTEATIAPTTEDILFNTIPTTTNEEREPHDNPIEAHNRIALAQLAQLGKVTVGSSNGTLTTILQTNNDEEQFKKDLLDESLFRDDSAIETTTMSDDDVGRSTTVDSTTEIPGIVTTVKSERDDTKIITERFTDEASATQTPVTTTAEPIIVLATKERVHVVTPEPSESSTAIVDSVIAATELMHREAGIESEASKRQRETVLNHERNEDARDTIDEHNRFVYAHLESRPADQPTTTTSTPPPAPTTAQTPKATKPTRRTLLEQLNLYHRLSEQNRKRLRLPTHQPSYASRRNIAPASTVRVADSKQAVATHFQQRNSDRSSERLFAWLPPNWTFERAASPTDGSLSAQSNQSGRPALQFWNGMPLLRDPGLTESTDRAARANSRSPTERLFNQEQQQMPADDVYQVVSTKNSHLHKRR